MKVRCYGMRGRHRAARTVRLSDKVPTGVEGTLILKRNCNFQTVAATHRPEYYIEKHYGIFNSKFSIWSLFTIFIILLDSLLFLDAFSLKDLWVKDKRSFWTYMKQLKPYNNFFCLFSLVVICLLGEKIPISVFHSFADCLLVCLEGQIIIDYVY